ncbi:MAG: aldo/keto reductase [Oscillospiraceae bacterium]|nr:aldo/keto reductase [Oscillospiraceae bacterium]
MLYRENQRNGDSLSRLGFGCMRLPRKGAGVGIDIKRSADIIYSAIEQGVNFFDTAYIYPGSENALGQILYNPESGGNWREKINISTKMPLFIVKSGKDFDMFFSRQLERLKTDYIDYYMLHMLTDFDYFDKIRSLGIEDWVKKEKDRGRIKNIGFSFHGSYNSFAKITDAYNWDFCMLQYNYLDENHQAGTAGVKYAYSKNLPVIAMEPLRGGKLAAGLPEKATSEFKRINQDRTPADWALRWLWNKPEITVVLSGMGSMEQLNQNVRTAQESEIDGMTPEELDAVKKVVGIMRENIKVNCTNCGYCMPCPANIDIPEAFSRYNESVMLSRTHIISQYMMSAGVLAEKTQFASQCIKCGKCEKRCPQEIKIMDELAKASKYLEPFWVKTAAKIIRRFTVGGVKNKNKI